MSNERRPNSLPEYINIAGFNRAIDANPNLTNHERLVCRIFYLHQCGITPIRIGRIVSVSIATVTSYIRHMEQGDVQSHFGRIRTVYDTLNVTPGRRQQTTRRKPEERIDPPELVLEEVANYSPYRSDISDAIQQQEGRLDKWRIERENRIKKRVGDSTKRQIQAAKIRALKRKLEER